MTARVRYTLTVVIEGDDYPATATTDRIEDAIKAMGEGFDLTGDDHYYLVTVADTYDPALPAGATVAVTVQEMYL